MLQNTITLNRWEDNTVVYIFEAMSNKYRGENLEDMRQDLIQQIQEGCVFLPFDIRLKEVVKTPIGIDLIIENRKDGNNNA